MKIENKMIIYLTLYFDYMIQSQKRLPIIQINTSFRR